MNAQIACPNCRSTISFLINGNMIDIPLTCSVCGQLFAPNFYCPDARSSSRHIFAAASLRVDNLGTVYTFCPEHTFTTYALAADSKPRPKQTSLRSLARFLDSLLYRLTLDVEALRLQMFARR
jgi:hypothetical protein